MNPYLEQEDVWHDFHERLIPVMAEILDAQAGPNYIVKIHERIYVHDWPRGDLESLSALEIRDRRDREVISTVKVLSPTNKRPGPHREQCLGKRGQILASSSHLLEIGLRRERPRMPLEGLPPRDDYALVSRAQARPCSGPWPLRIRDPLPVLPVPLRPPDREIHLDLEQALDRVYNAAGYGKHIYAEEPNPALSPDDAAWARSIAARSTKDGA